MKITNALNIVHHTTNQNKTNTTIDSPFLSKFDNIYNYNAISYPTSLEDIKVFEINNELCIHIYTIKENNDVAICQLGNIKYYKNQINLLSIFDE